MEWNTGEEARSTIDKWVCEAGPVVTGYAQYTHGVVTPVTFLAGYSKWGHQWATYIEYFMLWPSNCSQILPFFPVIFKMLFKKFLLVYFKFGLKYFFPVNNFNGVCA